MILKKLLSSINLFEAYAFCIYKIKKIDIVYKDKNFIFTAF